ncbi:hypothetical protein B0H11DRAFT_802870 [Mycena galericulata]|nr:hypothetical protein B0H11DRAFT_802870 [Mycena galericulata]
MLAKANQYLEENLRTSKEQNTELSFKINQLTNDLAAVHAKTAEFAQCVKTHEAIMMELQAKLDTNTTHTTATEAAHLLLESEMQKLLAKQAGSDEDLKAKQLELDAKAADVAAAQDALEALRDEAHAQNARVDEERVGAVDAQLRMEAQISALEAEAAVLRKNAADSDKEISRLRLRDGERGALEEAVIAKTAELRALRDQSGVMVARLEEDLRVAVTTAENVATQNVRLKENMKIQLLQLSELLKKRDNLVVKAKADLVKQNEEAEAERATLAVKLESVQAAYTDLKTLSDAQGVEMKELSQRKEAQAQDRARIKALEESNEKLEATNKNLRSSVFAAAKHTEQELQKGSEIQRGKLEGELRAAKSLNDKLQEVRSADE